MLGLFAAAAAAAGWVPVGTIFVGVGLLVVGFAGGMVAQLQSGKRRRHALESGPLVSAWVVACDPVLEQTQRRVAWARVLLSTRADHRWNREYLERVAAALRRGDEADPLPLRHTSTFRAITPGDEVDDATWLVDVMIYPDRLADGCLSANDRRVVLIVDTERRFAEHI